MARMNYLRDGRSPIPKSPVTSKVMSANKGRNTGPETALRKSMIKVGLRGYRLHWRKVPGSPDIAFPGRKKAVFVNGCFWHRCPYCKPSAPKSHTKYWTTKFRRNKKRDRMKIRELEDLGWNVKTVWECQIRSNPSAVASKIKTWVHSERS